MVRERDARANAVLGELHVEAALHANLAVKGAGLTIADAIDAALALNGSGGGSQGGPSTTTPGPLDVVP